MQKVGDSGKQRRPKINQIQKKLLVQLIENYFIRTTGRSTNVAFEAITPNAWDKFGETLNTWGPVKSSNEWKTCFYFMQNRVRKSVEMIRQCDSSVKNNLSDLDYKIYTMSPSGSSVALDELLNDDDNYGGCAVKEKKQNADNIDDNVLEDNFINNWALADDEFVGGNNDNLNEFRDDGSAPRVLVVQSMEELEEYENTSMIVDEEESIHETDDVIYASKSDGGLNDYKSCKPSSSSNLNVRVIEREGNESSQLQYNVPQKPPSKPNPRIPEVQKERLVQLIQNNFTKAFGRFTGTDGAHIKNNLWQTIAKELNTLGPPRTADQWKAVYLFTRIGIHRISYT